MSDSPQGGLLLIPDISGFTEFVHTVEMSHSQHITAELLEAVLEERGLGMELSEIEGDALLLYRMGAAPPLSDLMAYVSGCFRKFHHKLERLKSGMYCGCGACQNLSGLSLKIIGHFGEIGRQRIGGHTKLFGTDVNLAHRMLKNRVEWRDYALFSDSLWGVCEADSNGEWAFRKHAENYPVFGEVPMQVADLEPFLRELPAPPPEPPLSAGDGFTEEVEIAAPLTEVVEHLINFDKWLLWVEGLQRMEWDPSAPPRKGSVHRCVTDMGTLRATLEQMLRGERDFRMVFRYSPPTRILTDFLSAYSVRQEKGRVRLVAEISYDARRGLGWLARAMVVPKLRQMFRANLANLKQLLEG